MPGSEGVVATEAAQFVDPLRSLSVAEGDAACFTVAVSGRPLPRVSWRHQGEAVVADSSPYFEVLRSADGQRHSLRIGEVFAEDAGTVEVMAENESGSVTASAQLTVTRQYMIYLASTLSVIGVGRPWGACVERRDRLPQSGAHTHTRARARLTALFPGLPG